MSKLGHQPTPALISAISNAPVPVNSKQAESFISLVNFCASFILQFSTLGKPLYDLTKKDQPFVWSQQCQNAFDTIKSLLVSDVLVMHYNPALPMVIYTDASPYGIGSVLYHTVKCNGKYFDRPVTFVSSSLTSAIISLYG